MHVRPETPEDAEAIREIHRAAFLSEVEPTLVDALRAHEAYVPELSLVALGQEDGDVIGHVMFTRLGLAGWETDPLLLALAPVAVHPDYQLSGVGSRLIREGLASAVALGFKGVAVVGAPEYYNRFGFVPGETLGVTCPFTVPEGVFGVVPLYAESLEGIQGTVAYPAPFEAVSVEPPRRD